MSPKLTTLNVIIKVLPDEKLSRFSSNFRLTLVGLVICAIAFAFYVHGEKQIDHANELRQRSYLLASELRQSSDDLTRMVRTYVATGNPLYKKHYQEILDIRDGLKPRPLDAYNIYWDLTLTDDKRPRPNSNQAIPLLELMRQAGFTKVEFSKLAQAKANSDELTNTEYAAMRLLESTSTISEVNRSKATAMLYDAHYHQAKAEIMLPISQFIELVNERTLEAVYFTEKVALILRYIFILASLSLTYLLWRSYQSLHAILGGSVDEVHAHIARIGSGEFRTPIPNISGAAGSVMSWLSETQHELALLDDERKKSEEIIRAQNDFMNTIFDNEPECVKVIAQDGQLLKMNQAGLSMLEVDSIEEARQYGLSEFIMPEYRKAFIELIRSVFRGDSGKLEFFVKGKMGTVRCLETHAAPLRDASGQVISLLGVTRDITQAKQYQNQLEHIAHYDALTSLPNRVLLADRLQQAMSQSQRRGLSLAVAYLDLDGFKAVNDRQGHDVGDELLVVIAQRMKLALREGDSLARIGGDEFVAILIDLEQPNDCEPFLARILQAAAAPVVLNGVVLQVSASIGVTMYPQDAADAEQLMRHADQAMYLAKQSGKNRFHLFDIAQDEALQIQRESREQIRLALERREFVLYYQPKVNMKTGAVIGVEALIRWQHPERGLLPPALFLPIIEEDRLSVALGEWVIDTALNQMSAWRAIGLDIPVSVNVGARQLQQDDFVPLIKELLMAHPDIPPDWLELEILETSALEDMAQISEVMRACRALGVQFALDDFGTGYSSLTYLKHLPAELLKIDQSFVRDMLIDSDDLALVEGVIGLSTAFRRRVIAEGVETIAHGTLLLSLGCELAQGYGIARPMVAADLSGWVASWRPDIAWSAS